MTGASPVDGHAFLLFGNILPVPCWVPASGKKAGILLPLESLQPTIATCEQRSGQMEPGPLFCYPQAEVISLLWTQKAHGPSLSVLGPSCHWDVLLGVGLSLVHFANVPRLWNQINLS